MHQAPPLPAVIPWWTTNGQFVPEEARRQLDEFLAIGVTEFFVYPNFGLIAPDFLTEEWFDFIAWLIRECQARRMHFWLYDELSWPSGSAGGRLCREHPEYLMRTLRRSVVTLAPGESWRPEAGAELYQLEVVPGVFPDPVMAAEKGFCNDGREAVTLSIVQKILIDDHFFCSMGTVGTTNETGVMDALNPAAVRCFMEYNYVPYAQRFPEELGRTIRGFFFDEPTMVSPFHTGDVPWTPGLETLFAATYGYDWGPHLRALFEDVPGEEQFRLDFWSLAANRFATSFSKQLSDWCEAHHLLFSGHCWPEEPSCQRLMTTATGDIHLLQQYLHVPGTDMLFAENSFAERAGMCPDVPGWARNLIYSAKHPVSTARYNGARDTICEMSGIAALGDAPGAPSVQKKAIDFLAVMGISIMNPARPYDLTGFRKYVCAPDAGEPYWKYYGEFSRYIARLGDFNRIGRTKTAIAVLDPLTAKFALSPITPDTSIRKETTPLPAHGDCAPAMLAALDALVRIHRDFELIFEEVIAAGSVSEAGELRVPESAFKAVILPQCTILDEVTAQKLAAWAAQGGTLIAVGEAPQWAMAPGGRGKRPLDLPVVRLDDQSPDFAAQLAAALDAAVPADYALQGSGAECVLTHLREDAAGRSALLLVNGSDGRKSLTLFGAAVQKFHTLTDLAAGQKRAWNACEIIELEAGGSLLLEEGDAPAADTPIRCLALPETDWRIAAPVRNGALMQLEARVGDAWLPLADNGSGDHVFDPDVTAEVTLRGTFRICDAVPEDLRLWLDVEEFRDLAVNGRPVTARRTEKVIDPRNVVAPIASSCQVGENRLTVTVKLSSWLTAKRGIRVHFGLLMKNVAPPVLLGSFRELAPRTLAPLPAVLNGGDLTGQGFPHFADELVLEQRFNWAQSVIPRELVVGPAMLPVTAEWNGKSLGTRLWQNGNFAIPEGAVRPGENTLRIRLSGEIGNLLERRWAGLPVQTAPFVLPEIGILY